LLERFVFYGTFVLRSPPVVSGLNFFCSGVFFLDKKLDTGTAKGYSHIRCGAPKDGGQGVLREKIL
jgi:hypothetical protein